MTPSFVGKFRAKVVDINDPEQRGRIKVMCPKVLGNYASNWCEPCSPFAYDGGGYMSLPKVDDTVWIEFEESDQNKPVWVGSWWSKNKSPFSSYADSANTQIIERDGAVITLNKSKIVASIGGCSITITSGGIHIVGNVTVEGDVTADGISLKTHVHSGVESGGDKTGKPV